MSFDYTDTLADNAEEALGLVHCEICEKIKHEDEGSLSYDGTIDGDIFVCEDCQKPWPY